MFVVKNDDGKNDHRSYNSIYFNYFLISYYRVRLFLAMQVRVMAACMESQSFIRSAQSRPRDGTCVSDVCVINQDQRLFSILVKCKPSSIIFEVVTPWKPFFFKMFKELIPAAMERSEFAIASQMVIVRDQCILGIS